MLAIHYLVFVSNKVTLMKKMEFTSASELRKARLLYRLCKQPLLTLLTQEHRYLANTNAEVGKGT